MYSKGCILTITYEYPEISNWTRLSDRDFYPVKVYLCIVE